MKYLLLVAAIGLSLAGCGEQGPEKSVNTGPLTPPPAVKNHSFIKATSERPSAIPAAPGSGGVCQVDWVNDAPGQKVISITEKTKVRLVGWAANLEKGTSPQEVFIELDGPRKVYFKAIPGLKRLDIVSAYNRQGMADSGWEAYVDLSEVPAGTYKVQVIQVEGPSGSTCDTLRSIAIN